MCSCKVLLITNHLAQILTRHFTIMKLVQYGLRTNRPTYVNIWMSAFQLPELFIRAGNEARTLFRNGLASIYVFADAIFISSESRDFSAAIKKLVP